MPPAPIVLLETDYETLEEAIAAKDAQTAQLDAQGIPFQQQTLYRATDGRCVFVITPEDIEPVSTPRTRSTPRSSSPAAQPSQRQKHSRSR